MFCKKCGYKIENDAKYCPSCGIEIIQDKKKSVLPLIVVLSVIALIIIVALIIVINNMNHDDKQLEKQTKEVKRTSEYIKKKIDVSKIKVKNDNEISEKMEIVKMIYNESEFSSSIFILLKNNNDIPVQLNVFLNYLDKNNMRVDRTSNNGYVNPGKYIVLELNNMTKEEYSKTNIEIDAMKVRSYMHVLDISNDSIKSSVNSTNDIISTYTNTNENTLNIFYGIIYYKNNEIVFFDSSYSSDVKYNALGTANFYISKFPNYDYKKDINNYYDRYEVFISGATYKDSTY
ncbi:MAG: zinc ribbon domain-containing protein [Bacilli bacterium]|nr:zinc ribbon domain-containing protein [Bacilli bacterium]